MMTTYCGADNTSQALLNSLKAENGGIWEVIKERIRIIIVIINVIKTNTLLVVIQFQ